MQAVNPEDVVRIGRDHLFLACTFSWANFDPAATAVTRQLPGLPPITPLQRISVKDAIDAYTINGAKYLALEADAGSIEVGKSADFVVIDRDIVKLGEVGQGLDIAKTRVLQTWFKGANVYNIYESCEIARRRPNR